MGVGRGETDKQHRQKFIQVLLHLWLVKQSDWSLLGTCTLLDGCSSEEHQHLLMVSTVYRRHRENENLLSELKLNTLHTKKVRYSEVMLLLHSKDMLQCWENRKHACRCRDHPQKSKPSQIGIVTANARKANPICFNTDHIISIHCSQLSLSDSISSSLKMNRKLKFQRSAVRINQWRQINVHWNFMNFEPIQMKKS